MADNALSESLEIVVERVGNPAPRIYERMFKRSPELEPMFVLDRDGSVRAEMIRLSFDALLDLEQQGLYARGLIATELTTHGNNGITPAQFLSLFDTIRDVVREIVAEQWQPRHEQAWNKVLSTVGDLVRADHK
jgi:hemoglobin-like flavoprotein